ncbi:phage major capsid protein [Photobacterium satsumensis]|uniref:phage major capsid protein n=1 Tax=Photobacterium satsumensis TaxID=2910239 RepID=UPI003D1032DB
MRTQAPNPTNYKNTPEDAIRFARDSIEHNNDQLKEHDQDISDLKDHFSTLEAKQKADPVAFKKEVIEPSKEMLKHVDDYLLNEVKQGKSFQQFLKERGVTEYSTDPIYCETKSAWTGNSQDIIPAELIDAADITPRTNSALLDSMFFRGLNNRDSSLITLDSRTSDGRTSEWNPTRQDPDLTDTPTFKANKFYGFKPHKKYILSNEVLFENIYGQGLAGMIQAICQDDVARQVETEFLFGDAKRGDSNIEGVRGLLRDIVDYRTAAEEAEEGAQPSYTEALKGDDARHREVIQVIKSGVDNGLPTTNDDLIALLLTVKNSVSRNKYGEDLRWYMPVEVWEHLENRKDENGRPLFKKDLIDDLGYKLLGYDVEIVDNWVDPMVGTGKEVGILFGNMSKVVNRSSLHSSLIIDPFTVDGAVKYYQEQWDMMAIAENDAVRAVAFTA